MPLVIRSSGAAQYVRSEEVLAEILGHSNFDGEDWSVGDRLIFEDGTEARIRQQPGEQFYTWSSRTPADFEEVKQSVHLPNVGAWPALFACVGPRSSHKGCLSSILFFRWLAPK